MMTIRWAKLEDAYGPATSQENGGKTLPDLLAAVVSRNRKTRVHAFEWLWSRICHQGSVYPASVPAVPILLGHLPDAPDRATILELLTSLAIGNIRDFVDGRWAAPKGKARTAKTPESRCYRAAEAGVPLVRTLLTDRDANVRVAAAGFLAWFRDAETTRVLRQRTEKETHRVAKLAALLALGLHADQNDRSRFEAFAASKDLALAAAGAIARVCVSRTVPDTVRDTLKKASTSGALEDLRPLGEDLAQHAQLVLDRLPKQRASAPSTRQKSPRLQSRQGRAGAAAGSSREPERLLRRNMEAAGIDL